MEINVQKNRERGQITFYVDGRINARTSHVLRTIVQQHDYYTYNHVYFDFTDVEHVTVAGLREMLILKKRLYYPEQLKIINASEEVYKAFVYTGVDQLVDVSKVAENVKPKYLYLSFKELLARKVETVPDKPFVVYKGRQYTWRDIEKTSQIIALDLYEQGVRKGSHVAICGTNSANWIFTFFAIQRLGAVAMLVNFNLKSAEIIQLSQIGDITHFCMGEMPEAKDRAAFAATITGEDSQIKNIYNISDSVDFTARYDEYSHASGRFQYRVDSDDATVVIFSSGTTGKPKGVILSAFNVLNAAEATATNIHLDENDRNCQILPLFHIFGFTGSLFASALRDAPLYIPENLHTETILSTIEKEQCTILHSVPTMMLAIVNNKEFASERVKSVRCSLLGGAATTEAQFLLFKDKFPNNHIISAYGLSELAIATESEYGDTLQHITKTIGKPMGDIEVSIRSLDGLRECKRDGTETGEICLRGSFMMLCYYKLPLENQAVDAEGWLHTGDLGYIDQEGYVHLAGRSKEIIIRGGENLIPNEIASAICEHDSIHDVKVLGVPDDFFGEAVAAALLLNDGAKFDEDEMRDFLKTRLAKYKIPAYFEIYEDFPYLSTGKVDMITLKKDIIHRVESANDKGSGGTA